jgi:Mat/Ecp fimbriae periplasmic chaperone
MLTVSSGYVCDAGIRVGTILATADRVFPMNWNVNFVARIFRMLTLAALVCPVDAFASPSISIGAMYDFMVGGKATMLKQIRNSGTSTAYVRVDIAELDREGNVLEGIVDASNEKNGLIASPSRLIIPPGGSQAVRLLMLGDRQYERYFRARFVPVQPTNEHGFSVSSEEAKAFENSLTASMNLLIGYGSLVTVAPSASVFDTEIVNEPGQERVRNRGNTTIFLNDVYACSVKADKCEPPVRKRIAPGREESLVSDADGYYKFELQEGIGKKSLRLGN